MSVTLKERKEKILIFNSVSSWCFDLWHWRTSYDIARFNPRVLGYWNRDSGSILLCPRNSRINRNISARIPGGCWREGSWSDDNAEENSIKDMGLPRALIFLDICSILFVVSSYLSSQLGRILSCFAPSSWMLRSSHWPTRNTRHRHTKIGPFCRYKESFTSHILSANAMVRWVPQCIEFSATARH